MLGEPPRPLALLWQEGTFPLEIYSLRLERQRVSELLPFLRIRRDFTLKSSIYHCGISGGDLPWAPTATFLTSVISVLP